MSGLLSQQTEIDIALSEISGFSVIKIVGPIGLGNAAKFREILTTWSFTEVVLLDLSLVSFVDSRGLAVLIDTKARLASEGRDLRIFDTPEHILSIFRICGAVQILKPYASFQEARLFFRS